MNMGIGEAFFQRQGAWVLRDGGVVYEAALEDCFYHMELGGSDAVVHGNDERLHIVVDRQEYGQAEQGIDIVLYDELLEKVVDVVGFQAAGDYTCVRQTEGNAK